MTKRATAVCVLVMAAISVSAECAKNVVINAAVTRTRLSTASAALPAKSELVLRNIRFEHHPGTQFNVILERRDDRTKRARVGMLSFYTTAKARITRTFDVTDELRHLAITDPADVNVVFEATSGRGGAYTKSTFDSRSKLTIGEIELRAKSN